MSVDIVRNAGRRAAEARMGAVNDGSDCIVRRRGAKLAQDEANLYTPHAWTVLWSGPMRLANTAVASQFSTGSPGTVTVEEATRVAHLPFSATVLAGLMDGDWIEITAGDNAGTVWQITEGTISDQKTARRFPVKQIVRPREW